MNNNTSNQLFEKAKQHIPGGVNSPVRAFKSVGGNPIFIKKRQVLIYLMKMIINILIVLHRGDQ